MLRRASFMFYQNLFKEIKQNTETQQSKKRGALYSLTNKPSISVKVGLLPVHSFATRHSFGLVSVGIYSFQH